MFCHDSGTVNEKKKNVTCNVRTVRATILEKLYRLMRCTQKSRDCGHESLYLVL